jgi:GLPGLI family protein
MRLGSLLHSRWRSWKFGDLPGMILAVKLDDYVSWEAIGIRIKNVSSDFKIPENLSVR